MLAPPIHCNFLFLFFIQFTGSYTFIYFPKVSFRCVTSLNGREKNMSDPDRWRKSVQNVSPSRPAVGLLGKRENRHEVRPFGRGITSVTYNHHVHEALTKWDDPGGYRNGCLFLIRWLFSYNDLIEILLQPVIESIEECHSSRSFLDWKKRLEKQKKKLK